MGGLVPYNENRGGGLIERLVTTALTPSGGRSSGNPGEVTSNLTIETLGFKVDGTLDLSAKQALMKLAAQRVTQGLSPEMRAQLMTAKKVTAKAAEDAQLFTAMQKEIGQNLAVIHNEQLEQTSNMLELSRQVASAEADHMVVIADHEEQSQTIHEKARLAMARRRTLTFNYQ